MNEYYIDETELDELAEMISQPDSETGAKLVRDWLQTLQVHDVTHLKRQLHSLRDDFSAKKAVIDYLDLPLLQAKRAFAWNEPRPPVEIPDRLIFRSFAEVGYDIFFDTVDRSHQQTLDRMTKNEMDNLSNLQMTQAEWLKSEYEDAVNYFNFEPEWWQLAYNQDDQIVGYVQPVLFPDSNKGDLAEATLYYIGVVPEARGNGYVNDLLAKSISILQTVGVWRIYSDTDSENFPMIRAFQKAGFEEDGVYYIWQGEVATTVGRK